MVGSHMDEINDWELVLVGPNLQHGWFTHQCSSTNIREITLQFHRDLLDDRFLQRNQMSFLRHLLLQSQQGILFSQQTIEAILPRLELLTQKQGFDSVLDLFSILHTLSTSTSYRILSDISFQAAGQMAYSSRRIETVMAHLNKNYSQDVSLSEAAGLAAMSAVAFSRFFKMQTGKTFVDTLTDIRLGHAARLLMETAQDIGEIAYCCGFNNLSNFNRLFKKKKHCTPKEYRRNYRYSGNRTIV